MSLKSVWCYRQKDSHPSDVQVLIPETCDSVTLRGKRDFAHVVNLRILRWGDCPKILTGQCNHIGPYGGKMGDGNQKQRRYKEGRGSQSDAMLEEAWNQGM